MNSLLRRGASGEAEVAATAALQGERRQVTALFYDIVDSTTLLNRFDPEDFALAQRRIHTRAKAIVERHGGYLERFLGDGGCAYFGYPEAAEDAAECAVAAALEIAQGVPVSASDSPGLRLQVRVGVATGIVVLTSTEGMGLSGRDEIVGVAPTLAARLQSEAQPATVAVAQTTYAITRSAFTYEPLGAATLKGFAEPQKLWRPVAKAAALDRFSTLRRAEAPLVGREEELELCLRRWSRAREGHDQMVVLTGEPGIGKSRLVAELRRVVAREGCDARVFQCQPRGETQPLHPILDALRVSGWAGPGGTAPESQAPLGPIPPDLGAHAGHLFFLMDPGAEGAAADREAQSAEEGRRRSLDAVMALLDAWAAGQPQLVVLEDIHWADTLTQALVRLLAERTAGARRLVVVTSRNPLPEDMGGESHTLALALTRLDPDAVDRMIAALWGPEPPVPAVSAFIRDRGDGVPLLIEEVAQVLKDRVEQAGGTTRDWERVFRDEGVVTLRDFIAARLSGLGEARRVAQVASVMGREFPLDLLEGILAGPFGDALGPALQRLTDAGLLRRSSGGPTAFRFRHVLIQEAAYDSLLRSERRELHSRIVDLAGDGGALGDEALAWHCEGAARFIEAAQHAVRAAEACAIRSAPHEALQLLDRAAANLLRAGDQPPARDLELQALAVRGPIAMALFGVGSPQARAVYERGVELARALDAQERERWFPLFWGWWMSAPDSAVQHSRAQSLVDTLRGATDPEVRLQSFHCAWAAAFDAGEHARCLHCIEQGLSLYDPERAVASRTRYGGHDARVCGLGERALASWFLGAERDSEDSLEAALRWANEADHLGSRCHALHYQVALRRYQEDYEGVVEAAERMRDLAQRHELPGVMAQSQIYGGWARAHLSGFRDEPEEFKQGFATYTAIETEDSLSMFLDMQADLLAQYREGARALDILDGAIESRTRSGQAFWLPELHRRRALLRLRLGEPAGAAQADLRRAFGLAMRQGAVTLANRARADLARLGVEEA